MEGEDLALILPTVIIFPFKLSLNMTFPPFILVMLENNELFPIIYIYSKHYPKTISYTPLIPTHKNQDEAFCTHTFLGFFVVRGGSF
jgi:hypothetical protein